MNKDQIIKEHYQKIAKKGGLALAEKYGKEYMKTLGKKGGRPKKKLSTDTPLQ